MATATWTETALATITSAGVSTSLARNAVVSSEFNATAKFKVFFQFNIDRTTTAALTNGVELIIRPESGAAGAGEYSHGEAFHATSATAAGVTTTIATTSVVAGDTTLTVASSTSWAAGDIGIIAAGTAREEWFRVARVTDATHLLIDRGAQYAHTTAQADALFNKSDAIMTQELPGGTIWQIVFDYGDDAAGGSVRVWGSVFSLDSIT